MESYRTMDVVASEHCTLYDISVDTLRSMLGENYKDLLFLNCIKSCFQQSAYFKKLDNHFIEDSFTSFKLVVFPRGEVVIKAGTLMSANLLVVLQGNLIDVILL